MSTDPDTPEDLEARLIRHTPRPTGAFRARLRALVDAETVDLVGPRPAALRWKIGIALATGTLLLALAIAAVI